MIVTDNITVMLDTISIHVCIWYIHVYIHIYVYIHTYMHIHTHTCVRVVYVYIYDRCIPYTTFTHTLIVIRFHYGTVRYGTVALVCI